MKLIGNAVTLREETVALCRGRGTTFCLLRCSAIMVLCLLLTLPSHVCFAEELPPHAMALIKQKAAREFSNDETLRLLTIERQRNAYREVRNYSNTRVPENILDRIKKRATFECPGDYCAQQYLIESQSRDYLYLKDYLPKGVSHQAFIEIMQTAELEFPDDFSTRRLIVDARITKCRDLKKLSPLEDEAGGIGRPDIETKTVPDTVDQIEQTEEQTSESIQEEAKETLEKIAADKRYHEIRKGENLYRISLRYGLSLQELCQINGITPHNAIMPGQKLLVTP